MKKSTERKKDNRLFHTLIKFGSIVTFFVSLSSCQQDISKVYKQQIIGEWYPIYEGNIEELSIISGDCMNGYHFMANGLCENKVGYYDYIIPDGVMLEFPDGASTNSALVCGELSNWMLDNVLHFYGNISPYDIVSDSLKIFDLAKKEWVYYKIEFPSKDTLIITFDSYFNITPLRYVRKEYATNNQPIFDRILFHYPESCYSPEKFYSLDRSGRYISYGYESAGEYSLGEAEPAEFEKLENLFNKTNFTDAVKCMQDVDFSSINDAAASNVTFIPGHNITTVKMPFRIWLCPDYKEFYWAYLAGLFLPENLQYRPYPTDDIKNYNHSIFKDFSSFHFIKNDSMLRLSDTERFLLSMLLIEAKETNQTFLSQYILQGVKNNKDVNTDGRYFTYINENGKKKTLDLGYNFIQDTGLYNQFWKKFN